jgi:hypothetical protein
VAWRGPRAQRRPHKGLVYLKPDLVTSPLPHTHVLPGEWVSVRGFCGLLVVAALLSSFMGSR